MKSSIGQLCEHLYEIIGQMIKQYVDVFGLYPGFVPGIMNSTKQLISTGCIAKKLNYEYYIKKVYFLPKLLISYRSNSRYFHELSSQGATIFIMFKGWGFPP